MSKVKSITIVNQQGTNHYAVGKEYNGLLLDHVCDYTVSGDNLHVPHFRGFTADKQLVFEVINAPIDIAYYADT